MIDNLNEIHFKHPVLVEKLQNEKKKKLKINNNLLIVSDLFL